MPPLISVVVPFHNNRNEIGRCCQSLLNQSCPKAAYEIIFVDNNSTDGSASIVAAHPSIRLLQQSVPGSYAARNLGIRSAVGEIIAFTDADCVVAPDWLASIGDALSSERVHIILGAYSNSLVKFPSHALAAYENAKNRYIFASRDQSLYYGYTNNMAVRRGVFEEFGYFREVARGGDSILVRSVAQNAALGIEYIPGMLVDHLEFHCQADYFRKVFVHSRSVRRLHGDAVMRPLTYRERHRAFRDMVRAEAYSPPQAALVYAVLVIGMLFWITGWLFPLPQSPRPPQRSQ